MLRINNTCCCTTWHRLQLRQHSIKAGRLIIHDALTCGRRLRTFSVTDDFNREVLSIEIDMIISAQRVVRALDEIAVNRGYSLKMRMDKGPELISLNLLQRVDGAETRNLKKCLDLNLKYLHFHAKRQWQNKHFTHSSQRSCTLLETVAPGHGSTLIW